MEVVVIKGDEGNKAQQETGIITEVYPGRDGKVRAFSLRAGKSGRAIQHMYPFELSCDITAPTEEHTMNAEAEEFRPRRNVTETSWVRINNLENDEKERPFGEQYFKVHFQV